VFVLYELEGLSGKEIVEITGRPEATIYQQLRDAQRTFRAAVTRSGA
jgi:DNA-directed RNA polymerase specialized sigma24 family protein